MPGNAANLLFEEAVAEHVTDCGAIRVIIEVLELNLIITDGDNHKVTLLPVHPFIVEDTVTFTLLNEEGQAALLGLFTGLRGHNNAPEVPLLQGSVQLGQHLAHQRKFRWHWGR